jgi:peptidoglycan hydrolase CwlO-like protein
MPPKQDSKIKTVRDFALMKLTQDMKKLNKKINKLDESITNHNAELETKKLLLAEAKQELVELEKLKNNM